jgi:Flp pilus assembly protein TadG
MIFNMSPAHPRRGQRRGGALVEFVVCLPVMALLIFASLQGANLLFVRQAAVQAAYETVKAAVRPDGSANNAQTLGEQVLSARNINERAFSFVPSDFETASKGTPITVALDVNSSSRGIIGISPFRNLTIRVEATMAKE